MTIKSIQLTPIFTFNEDTLSGEVVAFNATPDKSILIATALNTIDYTKPHALGTVPKSAPDFAQDYCVYEIRGGGIHKEIKIIGEKYNIHDVQLFPDSDVLMVCARTPHTASEDFGGNGRIYSSDGVLKNDIVLVDAIQSTQVSSKGTIWTGIFDEGTFDESGLKEWSKDGEKLYEFEQIEGIGYIWDCYALNVVSDKATYCYYYTDFPLVLIENNIIQDYWKMPIRGSHAFAIHGDVALFAGGYNDDNFYMVKLKQNHEVEVLQEFELLDENNQPLKFLRTANRGSSVYTLYDHKVYELDIQNMV